MESHKIHVSNHQPDIVGDSLPIRPVKLVKPSASPGDSWSIGIACAERPYW